MPSDPHEPARLDDHPGDGVARSTARMEAFADAVFAIAFTLPVVEIEAPDLHNAGAGGLGAQLSLLWPSYLGYALAAAITGIYWVQHHFAGAIYRTVGHWFNLATVVFLAAIGFVAFPARLFAESLAEPQHLPTAARALTTFLAVTGACWLFKWTVGRKSGHVDARLDPAYVERLNRRYRLSTALLIVGALIGVVSWQVGLGIAGLVTLWYVQAPETPVYVRQAPTVEGET